MDRREESGRVFGLTRLLLQMRGSDSPSHRRSLVTWPLQAVLQPVKGGVVTGSFRAIGRHYEFDDFEVQGYQHHAAIKAPVAV